MVGARGWGGRTGGQAGGRLGGQAVARDALGSFSQIRRLPMEGFTHQNVGARLHQVHSRFIEFFGRDPK